MRIRLKAKTADLGSLHNRLPAFKRDGRIETFDKSGIAPTGQNAPKLLDAEAAVESGVPALGDIELKRPVILIQYL